jgi:hypothetical protein
MVRFRTEAHVLLLIPCFAGLFPFVILTAVARVGVADGVVQQQRLLCAV